MKGCEQAGGGEASWRRRGSGSVGSWHVGTGCNSAGKAGADAVELTAASGLCEERKQCG